MEARSKALAAKALEKLGAELEADYRQERQAAAERLHNAFAQAIGDQRPSLETVLYVLEMLRHNLMAQRHEALFGPGVDVTPSKEPSTLGIAVM